MPFDPVAAIEACYAPGDDAAWLAGLARAFRPLAPGGGVLAALWERRHGEPALVASATLDTGLLPSPSPAPLPPRVLEPWLAAAPAVDTLRRRLARLGPAHAAAVEPLLRRGVDDALGILGHDGAGRGVAVLLPAARPVRVGPRTQHRLGRVASHLSTALRLRRLAEGGVERGLATAVLASAAAAGRLRACDAAEAEGLWAGVLSGRWSVVAVEAGGGARRLLVTRNGRGDRDPRALTARERDVLAHVASGRTNRAVGVAIGLAPSTVGTHLRSALAKLGLRSRAGAIPLLADLAGAPRQAATPRARA